MASQKSQGNKNSLLKVIILGNGGVEKSCLMNRYVNNKFDDHSFHTIGVEFLNKEIEVNNETYTLQDLRDFMCLSDRMEIELDDQLDTAILQQAGNPMYEYTSEFEPERYKFTHPTTLIPTSLMEITYLEEIDYWTFFHASRQTVVAITKKLKDTALEGSVIFGPRMDYEVQGYYVEKLIELVLWYLRNESATLEDGAELFELRDVTLVDKMLRCGMNLLLKLNEDSGISLRDNDLTSATEEFSKKCGFPNIIGILSNRIFTSENNKRMLLHVVCDHESIFKLTEITFDTRPRVALGGISDLHYALQNIPRGYSVFCTSDYCPVPALGRKGGIVKSAENFSPILKQIINETMAEIAQESLNNLTQRFPRLNKLHDALPEGLLAACIIQNYCHKFQDKAPLM